MQGLSSVISGLNKALEDIKGAVAEGMAEGMQDIANASLQECPMDTGQLRESMLGVVNGTTILKGDSSASAKKVRTPAKAINLDGTISFDTPYATIQHEIRHKNYTTSGTKWKYLEDPFNRENKAIEQKIEAEIKKVL